MMKLVVVVIFAERSWRVLMEVLGVKWGWGN
jgi:hypothetical protein